MKKIISLFLREYDTKLRKIKDEVVPGAEWVVDGEGVATRKYDGTCVLIDNGKMWKRYEIKKGGHPPFGFKPANDPDPVTGKQQGWVEVGNGNEDKWHREAVGGDPDHVALPDGTYELIGEKIQGNPENIEGHKLQKHSDAEQYTDFPRTYQEIKDRLEHMGIEGVVWHHPDGRMVKIKKKDFYYEHQTPPNN